MGWWVGIGLAVAFLAACVAFVVGERSAEPARAFGPADRGFLADMTIHHDQAVQMAAMVQGRATHPTTESFALDVLLAQRWELGRMYELLDQAGEPLPEGRREDVVMDWMDMATTTGAMPGYATEEQLEALAQAEGVEVDRLFLSLMRAHHLGGIHMAEEAVRLGEHPRVRDLAARMARAQAIEVNEYDQLMGRLAAG